MAPDNVEITAGSGSPIRTDLVGTAHYQVVKLDAGGDGLVYLNGAAGTKADGSLTVDQAAGTVAIRIEATATDDLTRQSGAGYDVKVQSTAAGVTLLTEGTCNIQMTETKTID